MTIKSIRLCQVNDNNTEMVKFFDALGLDRKSDSGAADIAGAVFLAGNNWIEQWQSSEKMPNGTMLHLEVDDAKRYAERLKIEGYDVYGPMKQHGEEMFFVTAPNGLQLAILTKIQN